MIDRDRGLRPGSVARRFPHLGQVHQALYPGPDTAIAYFLLFGMYSGIVPDGSAGLALGDVQWAGDAAILLEYVKGRTAREGLTLSRQAGRILEQWLAQSAALRSFAPAHLQDALWLRFNPTDSAGDPWSAGALRSEAIAAWVARRDLVGQDKGPLRVHRHRIRTTFLSRRGRAAWFGGSRSTIDPNHGARVEGDRYLTATTPTQRDAVESIIEEAQAGMLRKALAPRVLGSDQAAGFAERFPHLVEQWGLDDAAVRQLAGGARDVFTAACADPHSGLHGPVGKPCPARPWVCLLCPLAVFAPRHTPNLLRLAAYFNRQFLAMPLAQFLTVFGPYAQRVEQITDLIGARDPGLLARAAAQVADTDGELPLRPEERSA